MPEFRQFRSKLQCNLIIVSFKKYPSIRGTRSRTALALVKYFSKVEGSKRREGEHRIPSVANKKTAIKINLISTVVYANPKCFHLYKFLVEK